ncbi:MAG: hypothetical protein JWR33_2223 [Naasia sp.]|uniref:DUF6541 family protein n=1 Tax=Naasia sp. TaxID=2546198 RepID=UPI002608E49E|nr:DUF6541 family protein [Naasia sp.]MCU1571482.1 hypothetical protein [Naasia sp.]
MEAVPLIGVVLAALVVVLIPGLAVGAALGLRGLPLAALAGPVTCAVLGLGAVLLEILGIPFAAWSIALGVLLTAALALGIGVLLRRLPSRSPEEPRLRWLLPAWAAAAVVILLVVASALPAPDAISQTYDAVFHLNAAASILDTGHASSFTLYRLNNPGDDIEFYPAVWHALVALTAQVSGASSALATNATWLAVAIGVWVPAVTWLTSTVAPARARTAATVVAPLLASGFAAFPYLLLDWGTLYPTGIAYALMPVGLALAVRILRLTPDGADRGVARDLLLFAIWLGAEVFAHPRSMVSFAAVATPLLVAFVHRWLAGRARRPGGRRFVTLTVVLGGAALVGFGVLAAIAVLRYFHADERPISDRLNGGPARANQSLLGAVVQVLTQTPVVVPGATMIVPAAGLALLTIAGIVLALRTRGLRWLVASFAVLGVLYCLAASSDADLVKVLTGLWYKDKYRLFSVLPLLAVPLAAVAASAGRDWIARRVGPRGPGTAAIVAGALVVAITTVPSLLGMQGAIARTFALEESDKGGRLLDAAEVRLIKRLPEFVPQGESVVGNPWNGSALTWAIGGRESVFPHLTGSWGKDRALVAERLDAVSTDPGICAALDRLHAHYLFSSKGIQGGDDRAAEYFSGIDRAVGAPGFTEVARDGDSVLYFIDACAS